MKTRSLLCALVALVLLSDRAHAATLLMADYIGFFTTGAVKAVDFSGETPYVFNGAGGSPSFPRGITVGPDGNIYVGNEGTARVERYSASGAFIDVFVPDNGGDILQTHRVRFGPDGNFYVSAAGSVGGSFDSDIVRFDGSTGAFIDVFTSGPGPSNPHGFTWGPDGNLYVAGPTDGVYKYNGTTGAYISTFIFASTTAPALFPIDVLFDADGNLLVVSQDLSGTVQKFDGVTGAPMGTFISTGSGASALQRPEAIILGPDGNYYISNTDKANVLSYLPDGTFVDVYASGGGLVAPTAMVFLPPIPEPGMLGIGVLLCATLRRRR